MYSNQKEGILTTEDLLNISNSSSKCIFWYIVITYMVIIGIFLLLHIIDQHTEFSITDEFNALHFSLPGYGIMISILAMIPTIITYVVDKRSYKKYIQDKNLKTMPCF